MKKQPSKSQFIVATISGVVLTTMIGIPAILFMNVFVGMIIFGLLGGMTVKCAYYAFKG
jgi:hypothetical protein